MQSDTAPLVLLNDTVKAVKIDGAEATTDNVSNGSYKVSRPFNIITKDTVSDVAQDLINYIMSADGQQVIADDGYISVAQGDTFTSTEAGEQVGTFYPFVLHWCSD